MINSRYGILLKHTLQLMYKDKRYYEGNSNNIELSKNNLFIHRNQKKILSMIIR